MRGVYVGNAGFGTEARGLTSEVELVGPSECNVSSSRNMLLGVIRFMMLSAYT